MTATTKSLLESALALPEAERMAMAEALWQSLPVDAEELEDEAFADELERRSEEMDRDPSASISWEDLRKKLWGA
jgi:putative addiction module component (TIGR02574 family)